MTVFAAVEDRLRHKERVPVPDWMRWRMEDAPRLELVHGKRCALEPKVHWRRWMPEEDLPWQPAELAGAWMREIVRLQKPAGKRHPFWRQRRDLELLQRPMPYYWAGQPKEGELACVDLTAAYWQLYRVATFDLIYDQEHGSAQPGRVEWLGVDDPRIADDKGARNAVVGIARRNSTLRTLSGGCLKLQLGSNFLLQPHLWAWLQDTLAAVAQDAVSLAGAFGVAVDSALLPAEAVDRWRELLLERWGLESHVVAQGVGVAEGPCRWRIEGEQRRGGAAHGVIPLPSLEPGVAERLRENRRWLARDRVAK